MSLPALNWAFEAQDINASHKLVLLVLSDYAGAGGMCWPSVETISRRSCLNRKTVFSAIAALIEKGMIEDTGKRDRISGTVKIYRVLFSEVDSPKNGTIPKTGLSQKRPNQPSRNRANQPSQKRDTEPLGEPLKEPREDLQPCLGSEFELPQHLNVAEFRAAWQQWKDHRKQIKHPLTPLAEKLQLKKLAAVNFLTAIAMIEQSIKAGYRDIYDLKDKRASIPAAVNQNGQEFSQETISRELRKAEAAGDKTAIKLWEQRQWRYDSRQKLQGRAA